MLTIIEVWGHCISHQAPWGHVGVRFRVDAVDSLPWNTGLKLCRDETVTHLGSLEVNSLHRCIVVATTKDFMYSVALTRGPAWCSGKLGTHLVARSTVPVITKAVSHHHVVLRVRQAAGHLHWSDGT